MEVCIQMQDQTQQTSVPAVPSAQSPGKLTRRFPRLSSTLLVTCIVVIAILLTVTGVFLLQTGATSAYTLWSSFFTVVITVFTFVQIILAIVSPNPKTPTKIES
jgi:hypothetical protein